MKTLRDWECFDADSGKDLAAELREYFHSRFLALEGARPLRDSLSPPAQRPPRGGEGKMMKRVIGAAS